MSVFTKTYTRAIVVYTGVDCYIPSPNLIVSSEATAISAFKLVDGLKNFVNLNVKPGDVVYNTDDGNAAMVTNVDSQTTISLSLDIFTALNKYKIYQQSPMTGLGNQGAYIYNNNNIATTIEGCSIGGDFISVIVDSYKNLPIQMEKLTYTDGLPGGLLALW